MIPVRSTKMGVAAPVRTASGPAAGATSDAIATFHDTH